MKTVIERWVCPAWLVQREGAAPAVDWRCKRYRMNLHPQCRSPNVILALCNSVRAHGQQGAVREPRLYWACLRAIGTHPIEKDVVDGPASIEMLARVAAQTGEPDRPAVVLQKLLSIRYEGALPVGNAPTYCCPAPTRSNV
jgi:hypothetical protein